MDTGGQWHPPRKPGLPAGATFALAFVTVAVIGLAVIFVLVTQKNSTKAIATGAATTLPEASTTTDEPTTTSAAGPVSTTTTEAPTTTTPPLAEDVVFSGSGDQVVNVTPPIVEVRMATLTHQGKSNFIVHGITNSGDVSLTNEIGNYTGTTF